jgi:aerobic-type carbon monoxide dehydrogenase small subunit (CoxS/CutS family)
VNGAACTVSADSARTLLHVLREELDLTGAKPGCGEGRCGACTVLVDGRPVRSCVTPAHETAGRAVTTVEGLAREDGLHPLQRAFLDAEALQCGYCTPGMLMAAAGLLAANPDPDEAQIVAAMDGNICRCGSYPRIVAAIRAGAGAEW